MEDFIARHGEAVTGVLEGFDRVLFRGTLRSISHCRGLDQVLSIKRVLLKDFGRWAEGLSQQIAAHAQAVARAAGRPYMYLPSSSASKEQLVQAMVQAEGLVCVLACVEPCQGFDIHRDREARRLKLVSRSRKCRFFYFYYLDRQFGLMHVRLQSWLPMDVQVCLNGRSYLQRQLDREGIGYTMVDNTFSHIDNLARAQAILDRLTHRAWAQTLNKWVLPLNPLLAPDGALSDQRSYYWTIRQSEVATDVMFKDGDSLAALYPSLCRHAMEQLHSPNVLRFLGRKHAGKLEITGDLKRRHEGVRVKHHVGPNSIKMYDKAPGNVLRIETTINDPGKFRVYRRAERQDAAAPPKWRRMRKGVADTARRARVSLDANHRYLQALACVKSPAPACRVLDPVCTRVRKNGRTARGLRPVAPDDAMLFTAVMDGEHLLHGLTNGDLQARLYDRPARDAQEARRRSSRVGRLLRLLRSHGLIRKVPRQRLYRITPKGHHTMTLALSLRQQSLRNAA